MKRYIGIVAAALTLIGGVWAVSNSVFAQDGPPAVDNSAPPMFGPPPGPDGFGGPDRNMSDHGPRIDESVIEGLLPAGLNTVMPRAMSGVTLSQSRRSKMREILSDSRGAAHTLRVQIQSMRDQTVSISHSGTFDESNASTLAAKVVTTVAKLDLIAQKAQAKIYSAVLTDSQRRKIAVESSVSTVAYRRAAPTVQSEVERMSDQLNLSSDQAEKLAAILTDRDSSRKAASERLKPIWDTYAEAHPLGSFDASALQTAFDKSQPILVKAFTADLKAQWSIWNLLTSSQQRESDQAPPRPDMASLSRSARQGAYGLGAAPDDNQGGGPPDDNPGGDDMAGPPPDGGGPGGPPPDAGDGAGPGGPPPDAGDGVGPGGPPPDAGGPPDDGGPQ